MNQSKTTWLCRWIESNLVWTSRLACSAAFMTGLFASTNVVLGLDSDPQVTKAISFKPRQANVNYDVVAPADAESCTGRFEKKDGVDGLSVYNGNGQLIRRFLDTNNDRQVDQWCYFKDGIEVYRDIDSDFNSTADEYRWLGTNGTRWAIDTDEDGIVNSWKRISPEELTLEAIEAVKTGDLKRFNSLLLSPNEIAELGLGEEKTTSLKDKIQSTSDGFAEFVKVQKSQKNITTTTRWAHFAADKPGLIPAGSEGSTKDVVAYENVIAIVENDGVGTQVLIGTMVQVDGLWKLTDCPRIVTDGNAIADGGFFFPAVAQNRSTSSPASSGGISPALQTLFTELEKLDAEIAAQPDPAKRTKAHESKAETLLKLVDSTKGTSDMELWVRQFVDSVSSATMQDEFPDGLTFLSKMELSIANMPGGTEILPYVVYRTISTEYQVESIKPNANFTRLQDNYMQKLEKFANTYSDSPFAAEAMVQIALNYELAADEAKAKSWYDRVATNFAESSDGKKAKGALNRLNLANRKFAIAGKTIDNKSVETAKFAGRPVVVHYWASWCEPCKQDMTKLQKMLERRTNAFQVVGINLDNDRDSALSALDQTPANWPHIFDGEGFESDLAVGLGVLSVPVTILIDKDGVVAMSGSHFSAEMEKKLEDMLATGKGTPNQAANAKPAPNIPTNARVNGATNNSQKNPPANSNQKGNAQPPKGQPPKNQPPRK
ncbi:MAG: redoxin family protein [Pirellula sp.]|jgi:thiol-disulfide isomerase/thioredoxin|nr:redoxin family protein [Pirellula sp.]